MNTALKSLTVKICDEFGDELCAAICSGLTKNSTLEEVSLYNIIPSDDDGTISARNALSFLRTKKRQDTMEEPYVSTFRLEAARMMDDNTSLESLTIATESKLRRMDDNPLVQSSTHIGSMIKFEEMSALVSALQRDTTLKILASRLAFRPAC
jgi:hypothetical protein